LDEAKVDQKAVNKHVFFGYRHNSGMTGQNRHNWPDFSVRKRFWGLGLIIWWSLK